MSNTLKLYLEHIEKELISAFDLSYFPSLKIDHHEKAEIEEPSCQYSVLEPVIVKRSDKEEVLIEKSINSVRISLKIKQLDYVDSYVVKKYCSMIMKNSDTLPIVRKKAISGYNLSFLVTNDHIEKYGADFLLSFVLNFIATIDSEISKYKLDLNSRNRSVVSEIIQLLE